MKRRLLRVVFAISAGLATAACVNSPSLTRATNPEMFEAPVEAVIADGRQQAFADCIRDGFAASHFTYTNIQTRSERRDDGHRVEAVIGRNIVAASVDVTNDGRARLVIGKFTGSIDLSGERASFSRCAKTHGKNP